MGKVRVMTAYFVAEDFEKLKKIKGTLSWQDFWMELADERIKKMSDVQEITN